MKILDIVSFELEEHSGEQWWHAKMHVLGDGRPDAYFHDHLFHISCPEWRIAEYAMDPNNYDSVLHLLLHEHLLHKRTEVTCYTPGYTQQEALTHRLGQIQTHIDRHTARMDVSHKRLTKHEPHKHPALDPIRERGIDSKLLHSRRLHVESTIARIRKGIRI